LTLDRLAVQCQLIEPPDYLDAVELTSRARLIITDSGDQQEAASILRIPCLTLRARTERIATLDSGWNQCVGTRPATVFAAAEAALSSTYLGGLTPENWDGKAGQRIANALADLASTGLAGLQERRSGFFSQVALGS
jgi:UDP-N-acetylglucosamine 2-epimerase (non-hydrolysing)